MSTAKPHRRLTLTRPTAGPELSDPAAALELDRVSALEARCERLEALVAQLARRQGALPLRVSTESGRPQMEVEGDEAGPSLWLFDGAGRAVAVLSAENLEGGLTLVNDAGQVVGRLLPQDEAGGPTGALESGAASDCQEASSHCGEGGAVHCVTVESGEPAITRDRATRSVQVAVVATGGSLSGPVGREEEAEPEPIAQRLRDGSGLKLYSRGGRKAVALYAEGSHGAVRVYDESGSCVYSHQ